MIFLKSERMRCLSLNEIIEMIVALKLKEVKEVVSLFVKLIVFKIFLAAILIKIYSLLMNFLLFI